MKRQATSLFRLVPMAIIMGIIFFLSHQPGDVLYIPPVAGLDKVAHLSIYAVLAAAVLYAFSPLLCDDKKLRVILLTIGICLLYGVGDEFHQSFVPGRFPSLADIAADTLGAAAACAAWYRWQRKGRREAAEVKPQQSPLP